MFRSGGRQMREKREEETGDPKEIGQCRSKFYSVSTKLEEEGAVKKKKEKKKKCCSKVRKEVGRNQMWKGGGGWNKKKKKKLGGPVRKYSDV